MATLTFTVPPAALAVLDAYAQQKNYIDFHDWTATWMKATYRRARRDKNQSDAAALLNQEPSDPAIT